MSVARFMLNIPSNQLEDSHHFYSTLLSLTPLTRDQQHITYTLYNHLLTLYFIDK